ANGLFRGNRVRPQPGIEIAVTLKQPKVAVGAGGILQSNTGRLTVRLRLDSWPAVGADTVESFVLLGAGVLAGLAAQAIFLKSDLLYALRVAKKVREPLAILRQRSRPAGFPAVLQLDADQLAEDLVAKRVLWPRQKVVDFGLYVLLQSFLEGVHEVVEGAGERVRGGRFHRWFPGRGSCATRPGLPAGSARRSAWSGLSSGRSRQPRVPGCATRASAAAEPTTVR